MVFSDAPISLASSTHDILPFLRKWASIARSISAIRAMTRSTSIGILTLLNYIFSDFFSKFSPK